MPFMTEAGAVMPAPVVQMYLLDVFSVMGCAQLTHLPKSTSPVPCRG